MKSLPGTLLVALFIGTLAGSFTSALVRLDLGESQALYHLAFNTLWLFSFGIFVAGFAMMVYGYPSYMLLARWGAANWVTVSIVGALPGILAHLFARDVLSLPILLCGLGVSLVFFWLVGRRSPINQSKKAPASQAGTH